MSQSKNRRSKQRAGGASDYVGSFHSPYADVQQLSNFTLKYIDQSPMFRPLEQNTMIPTGTSGIIVTGAYYDSVAPLTVENSIGPPTAMGMQMGGAKGKVLCVSKKTGKEITNPWICHVFKFAEAHGINYSKALSHPDIKKGYVHASKK
jgi:hypothetical protein